MAKVCLNIYKRKDGRYEGRYKKGRIGKKLVYGYVYSRLKAEVIRLLMEKQSEYPYMMRSAKRKIRKRMTFSVWLSLWLETIKKPELKPTSYAVYERQIRKYLLPMIGEFSLEEFCDQELIAFTELLRKKEVSESTVFSVCRLLRSSLMEAREQGYVEKLPGRRVWPKAVPNKEARCLEEREREAILKEAAQKKRYEITAALCTGLRLGEITGLKWKDVDLQKGVLQVERAVQRIEAPKEKERTKLGILSPKSKAAQREIPIVPPLAAVFKEMWESSRKCSGDYVFATKKHPERPMDPRNIQRRFEKVCKSACVEEAHFHTLRHTFATICMETGFDVETLRYLMGHSSSKITLDCYAHSTKKHRREIMQRKFHIAV